MWKELVRNGSESSKPGLRVTAVRAFSRTMPAAAVALGLLAIAGGQHSVQAQASSPELAKVLSQLDAASANFSSAQADFAWDQLTAVVDSHDVQKGTIAFRRTPKGTEMVAHIKTDNDQPAPKDVLYRSGELAFYQPGIKQETLFSAGQHAGQAEAYLTLGFGGSGKDLAANWNIEYQGTEKIDGVDTAKLNLMPKKPAPSDLFTHVTIWVDPTRSVSLKQVFYEESGDTRTDTFSNIKLNGANENLFNIKVPSGTQVIHK